MNKRGDLISREALLQRIGEKLNVLRSCNDFKEAWGMKYAMVMIQNSPSVDAVEVVRCGECEFIDDKCAHGIVCICDHGGMCGTFVADTDFCSCGKRRMDGE